MKGRNNFYKPMIFVFNMIILGLTGCLQNAGDLSAIESVNEVKKEVEKKEQKIDVSKFSKYNSNSGKIILSADWDWSDCNADKINFSDFNYLQLDYEQANQEFVFGVVYSDDSRTDSYCYRYASRMVVKLDDSKKSGIKKIFFMSKAEAVEFKPVSITLLSSTDFFDPIVDSKNTGMLNSSISSINMAKEMKVGWNLGNVLDCYTGPKDLSSELAWKEPYTTKEIVELGKNNGYTTIRIPITWSNHIIDNKYTVDPQWMRRVKQIVDWAYDAGYYVIINEHHSDNNAISNPINKCEGYMVTSQTSNITESKAFLEAVWKQIAAAFNNSYNERLIFETQNEPADWFHPDCPGYPSCQNHEYDARHHVWRPLEDDAESCEICLKDFEVVNEYNQLILNTIRASGGNNSNRFVMIPGMGTSVRSPLFSQFRMPVDIATDKLMLTVHDYTMGEYAKAIKSTFTAKEEKELISMFTKLNNAYVKNGIPVVLGETGWEHQVYDTFDENDEGISGPAVSADERVKWITSLSKITSAYGMPLIYWDVGTSENKMGELDRKNLCIKSGDESFVSKMISNWDVSKKADNIFNQKFDGVASVLESPVTLEGWDDGNFSCSIHESKLTSVKEGSLIKITFAGDGFKNFAIWKYQNWNSISLTGAKYSELCDFSDGNNFTYSNGNSDLFILLSAADAEEIKKGFTIQGQNLTVTGVYIAE